MKEWQQPITTRRYLQPPLCERIIPLWREGKVTLGEVHVNPSPTVPDYNEENACGIWPLINGHSADVTTTENGLCTEGAPIHRVCNRIDGVQMTVEALCDTERQPTAFLQVTYENTADAPTTCRASFLLRTGKEAVLIPGAPDLYCHYAPDVGVWQALPATWRQEEDLYRDGAYVATLTGDIPFAFDAPNGVLYADIPLPPRSTQTVYLTLGKGTAVTTDYATQKAATLTFWRRELARITTLPEAIREDADTLQLLRHLTAQLLQCFARPVGEELVLCRQGGLQRRMWPFEALYVLQALDALGDFDLYVEPAIDLYFEHMQAPDGEVVPLGIYWAMASAMALYSFADHAAHAGKQYWGKHRAAALRAFACIRRTRASTPKAPGIMEGLYPPRQSCDAELVFQSWTFTDTMNLIGLRRFLDVAEAFEDACALEVRQEYESYRTAVATCFARAKAQTPAGVGLTLSSFVPGYTGDETLFAFAPFTGAVTVALELEQEDVERLVLSLEQRGLVHEGLYWRMPAHHYSKDSDGVMRVWYTTLDDYYWFETFLRLGMTDRCRQIIQSTLRYSTSAEYQMQERYHQRDPYFCPWSPNASANGRLISMLLKLSQ